MRYLLLLVASSAFAQVTVPVTDANVFWSPYNWFSNGSGTLQANNVLPTSTFVQTVNWGAYIKTGFTGTSFAVTVDTTMLTGHLPAVVYSVDGAANTRYTYVGGETSITLATGLSAGSHTVQFYVAAVDDGVAHWTTPTSTIKITGFTLDSAAATVAPSGTIAILPKRCLLYGDSITEGEFTLGPTVSAAVIVSASDASQGYVPPLSVGLNCEYGNAGFGGTGWITSWASGAVPAFPSTYDSYYATHSRLVGGKLAPIPDLITVNHGRNDLSSITATVISMAANLRGIVNTATPIFIIVPFALSREADFTTAFASITDPRTYLVDLGATSQVGLNGSCGGGTSSTQSFDSCHPKAATDVILAAAALGRLNILLNLPSTLRSGLVRVSRTYIQ